MKNYVKGLIAFLNLSVAVLSCSFSYGQNQIINVSGKIISNTTWTNDNTYLLSGFVYVKNNATLTIQPGTIIKGEKTSKGTLIVTRGAKLIADGTKAQPIVFTSGESPGTRAAGDWGGIIMLGKSLTNHTAGEGIIAGDIDNPEGDGKYGGANVNDTSGIIRYVRIEYPGILKTADNETSGFTLGGVGTGTIVDNVQVSYSAGDSYGFFGGTVNAKHLIAWRGYDDDFDTNNGYSGRLQFLVAIRDTGFSDANGSNGFESDNDTAGTVNAPLTRPIFCNVTIAGPRRDTIAPINSNFKNGVHLRRTTAECIYNSVIMGFPVGLLLDGVGCETNATIGTLEFEHNIIVACNKPYAVNPGSSFNIHSWIHTAGHSITLIGKAEQEGLSGAFNLPVPSLLPEKGSTVLTGSLFSIPNINNSFFQKVAFHGAFGATDWTECWAEWNPQNVIYDTASRSTPIANFHFIADSSRIDFTNASSNATSWHWDFGVNGMDDDTSNQMNPSYIYMDGNSHTITLIAMNACGTDSTTRSFFVTGLNNTVTNPVIALYPNPAMDISMAIVYLPKEADSKVVLSAVSGRILFTLAEAKLPPGEHKFMINTSSLVPGVYFIKAIVGNSVTALKLAVVK